MKLSGRQEKHDFCLPKYPLVERMHSQATIYKVTIKIQKGRDFIKYWLRNFHESFRNLTGRNGERFSPNRLVEQNPGDGDVLS